MKFLGKLFAIVLALSLMAIFLGITLMIPFITIWSLNTLFLLQIPYTFGTWFASCWLMLLLLSSGISVQK